MDSILLATILLANVTLLSVILIAFLKISRVYNELRAFVTPPAEGEPSPLATLALGVSDMIASSLMAKIKASLMQNKSAEVRGENAIEGELAIDLATQTNPIVGALLQQFPALRKMAKKNPALVDAVVQRFIAGKFGGNTPAPSNNNHSNAQVKMTL